VQAVDRDLNYSSIASLELTLPPLWHQIAWVRAILGAGSVILLAVMGIQGVVLTIRRRETKQLREQMLSTERAKNAQIATLDEQLSDENVRMGAELSVTERIQRLILPSKEELAAIGDLDIAAYMSPADEVGGDYYDVLSHDGRLIIAIGDVTGHGMESGMVMLMTQTAVRTLLESEERDYVRFLDTLNRTIYGNVQRMDASKSLTLCLLDYADGEVKLSGQHEELIVVRKDGKVELVDTMNLGFPIGLDSDIADFINQTTIQLAEGDGVVLYTDGITEAENEAGEMYGLSRLCSVVSGHWSGSAEQILDAVVASVEGFIGEQEIYDDITLVVLKQK
jgi:serine phosphatase RsbU (regulator of sigma subunit)